MVRSDVCWMHRARRADEPSERLCYPVHRPVKSEIPSTPRMMASPSITNCFWRFFRAALTIQGKRFVQS